MVSLEFDAEDVISLFSLPSSLDASHDTADTPSLDERSCVLGERFIFYWIMDSVHWRVEKYGVVLLEIMVIKPKSGGRCGWKHG